MRSPHCTQIHKMLHRLRCAPLRGNDGRVMNFTKLKLSGLPKKAKQVHKIAIESK